MNTSSHHIIGSFQKLIGDRTDLHRSGYQHPVVKIIDRMTVIRVAIFDTLPDQRFTSKTIGKDYLPVTLGKI